MEIENIKSLILDSWDKAVVFVDTDHIIRYMNKAAHKQYAKWGDVTGKSIFHCHNENSVQIIKECFEQLKSGTEEVLFVNNEKHRVYMRGVFDDEKNLMGYFERYEPPVGK